MARAQRRDAVRTEKFFFRKDIFPPGIPSPLLTPLSSPHSSGASSPIEPNGVNGILRPKSRKLQNCFAEAPRPTNGHAFGPVEDEYEEYTLQELFNGKVGISLAIESVKRTGADHVLQGEFPGLLGLVKAYLETLDVEASELLRIREYLDLVERRSNGESPSTPWVAH